MQCPDCSGPMWDNRQNKRNPKSPDFKCKDKSCGKGVWAKKQDGTANPAVKAEPAPATARRDWVPNGYRGQPIPYEVWVKQTADVLMQMVGACVASSQGLGERTPPPTITSDAILQEARSLVAQYWMAVERNLTFIPGYEPTAEAKPVEEPPHHDFAARIKTCGSAAEMEVLIKEIQSECQDEEMKRKLITDACRRVTVLVTGKEEVDV